MNDVLKALQFRHACKKFDPNKKIPANHLQDILTCAQLSPSSFGMEPWKFLVIQNTKLRQQLRFACWNQPQITDCSELIIILDKKNQTKPDSNYIKQQFQRRQLEPDAEQAYLQRYKEHYQNEITPHLNHYAWDSKQCYIALSNMMTAAASAEIDSCPIEGFEKEKVEDCLNLDKSLYEVVVILALGYRLEEQTTRLRLDLNEIVEFIR